MEVYNERTEAIIPYGNNAKKHDKKQIANVAESIKRFGFVQPIVVDANNVIVIGHCRWAAAQKLKLETVPCVRVNTLTPEQVAALRIADNKTNESAWDLDKLVEELAIVDLSGFDFDFGIKEADAVEEEGEVPFSEELLLSHNYVVLYFDNDFDWEVAKDKFNLKEVKDLIPRKSQPTGIGRVIDGKRVLEWLN
jgi:hypothetical protein